MTPPKPEPAAPGQESVWAYPRPAIAQPTSRQVRVEHRGVVVAATRRAVRTLETSHPPTYYVPYEDVAAGLLHPTRRRSLCEWKGQATYFDVRVGGDVLAEAAWSYPTPTPEFESLRGHLAFYAERFDACFVDDERVTPQPGDFYGGWITSREAGPFKGVPGSRFW